jgi:DNA-binding NtrC family response regulator
LLYGEGVILTAVLLLIKGQAGNPVIPGNNIRESPLRRSISMTFKEHIEMLERMKHIIRLQATGNPKEFAAKLNISESTLFRLLRELKDMGYKIEFNPYKNSYCYYNSKGHRMGYGTD